jgi:hypothetical protein
MLGFAEHRAFLVTVPVARVPRGSSPSPALRSINVPAQVRGPLTLDGGGAGPGSSHGPTSAKTEYDTTGCRSTLRNAQWAQVGQKLRCPS